MDHLPSLTIQLALDRGSLDALAALADDAAPYVSVIEVGTPVFMREGAHALRVLREVCDRTGSLLFADSKISDEGRAIAEVCAQGGADALSVVDGASFTTMRQVRQIADEHGLQVWVDLLSHSDPIIRARALRPYVDGFTLHRTASGVPQMLVEGVLTIGPPVRLAGGITIDKVPVLREIAQATDGRFEGIVVGRAVTAADDPLGALRDLYARCTEPLAHDAGTLEALDV